MATGPVVDQLAGEYDAAGDPVFFVEQNVDSPVGQRINRFWAAHGGGSASLPLSMISSGHQWSEGYLGSPAHDTYKGMVDDELARPPEAGIVATAERVGNQVHWTVGVTNLSAATLSGANSATVHALVYEVHTPVDPNWDHITGRIVRAAVSTGIVTPLPPDGTASFDLQTADLTNVVDWEQVHTLVLVDYRPGGTSGAYDMLQAAAVNLGGPAFHVYLPVVSRGLVPQR